MPEPKRPLKVFPSTGFRRAQPPAQGIASATPIALRTLSGHTWRRRGYHVVPFQGIHGTSRDAVRALDGRVGGVRSPYRDHTRGTNDGVDARICFII
jgi:hypothetical protein